MPVLMSVVTTSVVRAGPERLKSLLRTRVKAGDRLAQKGAVAQPRFQGAAQRISPSLIAGGLIVALVLLAALAAPVLAPYAPDQVRAGPRLAAPSLAHPFGADTLGRDMFSRVLFGARIAVQAAVAGMGIAAALGVPAGLLAGYRRGWLDWALSRFVDVWLAFPGLLLALVIVARLGPSLPNAVAAVGLLGAPGFYRLTRSLALSACKMAYVEAAQAVGCGQGRILARHILPNLASTLVVFATLRAGAAILAVGGLSFVGLGAQPPSPEWGALLAAGRSHMDTAPWLAIFPGLSLTLTVVGLNLWGDGLRDLWDGRSRPRCD
jgi:ABC-type dipeptide/oligopeptide/nickel transport system permease subunit